MNPVEGVAGLEQRARLSLGTSNEAIYRMVAAAIAKRHSSGGLILDVGCGAGQLWSFVKDQFHRYAGVDAVRYESFPDNVEFLQFFLDSGRLPLPDGYADVVAAVETIEHLENPRAFGRELTRLAKPGGWVVITTPNQLSLLSKLGLLLRNEFPHFRGANYPAHLTALLECDLRRIAAECGLTEISVAYSGRGRMPGVRWHWPGFLSRMARRALSDNVLLIGRKPA